jgi:hypothetical protein
MKVGVAAKTAPRNLGPRCGVEDTGSRVKERRTLLRHGSKTENRAKSQSMNKAEAIMTLRSEDQRIDLLAPERLALLLHRFVLSSVCSKRKRSDLEPGSRRRKPLAKTFESGSCRRWSEEFIRSGGSEFGHVRIRRGGPQCRCGGRGCIEAFLADYALYRDAQLVSQQPAPDSLMPTEASMHGLLEKARGGDKALLDLMAGAGEVLGDAVGILIQTLEPDHVVICGPGTRAWPLFRSAFDDALARASIAELRALTHLMVVEASHDLLTEGVIFQCLRELDAGLSRVDAA